MKEMEQDSAGLESEAEGTKRVLKNHLILVNGEEAGEDVSLGTSEAAQSTVGVGVAPLAFEGVKEQDREQKPARAGVGSGLELFKAVVKRATEQVPARPRPLSISQRAENRDVVHFLGDIATRAGVSRNDIDKSLIDAFEDNVLKSHGIEDKARRRSKISAAQQAAAPWATPDNSPAAVSSPAVATASPSIFKRIIASKKFQDLQRTQSDESHVYETHTKEEMERIYERAAGYVEDSFTGRFANGAGLLLTKDRSVYNAFRIHTHWGFVNCLKIFIILHMCLAFWERPSSRDRLTEEWPKYVEILLVVAYIVDISLKMYYMGVREYSSKRWHMIHMTIVGTMFLDVLLALSIDSSVRFSRVVRPMLFLARERDLRQTSATVVKTIPHLASLTGFFLLVNTVYATAGVQMFQGLYDGEDGKPGIVNFDTFGNAFLALFVYAAGSENYPQVMTPAYKWSWWTILYFSSFYVLQTYLVLSLLIAIVVESYKIQHKKRIVSERVKERKALMAAFNLLDVDGSDALSFDEWSNLIKYVNPNAGIHEVRIMFDTIDIDESNHIDIIEFFDLCDIVRVQFDAWELPDGFLKGPQGLRKHLLPVVNSRFWFWLKNTVVFANTITLIAHERDMDSSRREALAVCGMVFTTFFVLEVSFEVCVHGLADWWNNAFRRFDFAILLLAFVSSVVDVATLDDADDVWKRMFRSIGALRVLRFVGLNKKFGQIAKTIAKIVPVLIEFCSIITLLMYVACIIGMELFSQKYPDDNLENFNSFGASMLLMFQVLQGAAWHIVLENAVSSTGHPSDAYFFIIFLVFTNFIIVNLLIATALHCYDSYKDLSSETEIEIPIPNSEDSQDSRHLMWKIKGSKKRWQRVIVDDGDQEKTDKEILKKVGGAKLQEKLELKRRNSRHVATSDQMMRVLQKTSLAAAELSPKLGDRQNSSSASVIFDPELLKNLSHSPQFRRQMQMESADQSEDESELDGVSGGGCSTVETMPGTPMKREPCNEDVADNESDTDIPGSTSKPHPVKLEPLDRKRP